MRIAVDPNFATNHYVYFNCTHNATSTTPAHNRVVLVTLGATESSRAARSSYSS